MPIPDAQKLTAEVYIQGVIAAEGASELGWISTFHYRRPNGALALSKSALATTFMANFGLVLQALLNNTWSATYVYVRMLEDITDPNEGFLIGGGGWTGGVAGDRMAPDNTAFFNVKSSLRGPQYRGRKFWSPMSESDTTAGTADLWNAGALARLTAVANVMKGNLTDANGNVWAPVIYSRSLSSTKPVPALIVATPIANIYVRQSIGRFKKRAPSRVY